MTKIGTVVIPHAYTTRWTQTCISSLKKFSNNSEFDILIVDNSIPHPSIRGITETSLGDNVKVISPKDPSCSGHQLALDYAIDLVETPWFIAWEPDVLVMRDGWLDWMLSYVKDEYVAIVGWYWSIGVDDGRHYISPAGALYKTSILKRLKKECLENDDLSVCYGKDMSKRINLSEQYPNTAGKLIPEKNWGPFTECRGFGNVYPFPREVWVPEPGNWIFNRCSMQWECIQLPGEMVKNPEYKTSDLPHSHAYIGDDKTNPYYIHCWAGAVSHNFEKHHVPQQDIVRLKWWLTREHRLWNEIVPEDVKKLTIEKGLVRTFEDEYAIAQSMVIK